MLQNLLTALAAVGAFAAAWFWYRASVAEVLADQKGGVGAMLGGGLVVLIKGRKVDLHGTIELQSRWNSFGAVAAGISALLTGLALLAGIAHW